MGENQHFSRKTCCWKVNSTLACWVGAPLLELVSAYFRLMSNRMQRSCSRWSDRYFNENFFNFRFHPRFNWFLVYSFCWSTHCTRSFKPQKAISLYIRKDLMPPDGAQLGGSDLSWLTSASNKCFSLGAIFFVLHSIADDHFSHSYSGQLASCVCPDAWWFLLEKGLLEWRKKMGAQSPLGELFGRREFWFFSRPPFSSFTIVPLLIGLTSSWFMTLLSVARSRCSRHVSLCTKGCSRQDSFGPFWENLWLAHFMWLFFSKMHWCNGMIDG